MTIKDDTSVLTAVDRVVIGHVCEDHAGQWYRNPMVAGCLASTRRYLAEGYLGKLCDRYGLGTVMAAVREHLDAHPECLAAALTDEQRAENHAARDGRATAVGEEAALAFRDGRWEEALTLIDRAELESPLTDDYEWYRRLVRKFEAGEVHQ